MKGGRKAAKAGLRHKGSRSGGEEVCVCACVCVSSEGTVRDREEAVARARGKFTPSIRIVLARVAVK